jgi:hypothetical protein
MIRGELRSLFSFDTPGGLDRFHPSDPDRFGVRVRAMVGPQGSPGEESFDLTVCTFAWLAEETTLEKGFAFLRHVLVVRSWDADLIKRAIADRCRRTEGETWNEVAAKLGRYGYWEFEDYTP